MNSNLLLNNLNEIQTREKSITWTTGDRFIPQRRGTDVSKFSLISSEEIKTIDSDLDEEDKNYKLEKYCDILKSNLKTYNKTYKKFFNYKSQNSEQTNFPSPKKYFNSSKKQKKPPKKNQITIPKTPYKILEAPGFQDNYYHSLISLKNHNLAIALNNTIYILNTKKQKITKLYEAYECEEITSLTWNPEGTKLAVGNILGQTSIWDTIKAKDIRSFDSHKKRIGSLAWGDNLLSGSKDKSIALLDPRCFLPKVQKFQAHQGEVCKVVWNPENNLFASGGNDNKVFIWSVKNAVPIFKGSHKASVRALAWSRYQYNVVFSGGGSGDGVIKKWNVGTKKLVKERKTQSQICSLMSFDRIDCFATGHGIQNEICVWRNKGMKKISVLRGHKERVLYLGLEEGENCFVSASADETIQFWKINQNGDCDKNIVNTMSISKPLR